MALNPEIALGVRVPQIALPQFQIQTPLERFAKVQSLRNLMAQGQLQQMNIQQTQLENQALQEKARRTEALASLFASGKRPTDDQIRAIGGPEAAAQIKSLYDADKSQFEAMAEGHKQLVGVAQGIQSLPENQRDFAYRAARSRLHPTIAAQMPEQYPGHDWITEQIQGGLTSQQFFQNVRDEAEAPFKLRETKAKASEAEAKASGAQLESAVVTMPNNQAGWDMWYARLPQPLKETISPIFSPAEAERVQRMSMKPEVGKTLPYPTPVQTQRETEWRLRLEQQNDPLGLFKTAPTPTTPAPNSGTQVAGAAPAGSTPATEVAGPGQEPKLVWIGPDGQKYTKPPAITGGPAPAAARPRYSQDLTGEDLIKSLPGPVAQQVKAIAEGRLAIPTGAGLRSPYWQQMLGVVGQYDPSFDVNNPGKRMATAKAFASGKEAQQVNALNTVIGHLESLSKATDAMGNTWSPAFNSVKNWISAQRGKPEVKDFEATKKAVVDELTRVWRGTGGSEGDIKTWSVSLDAANSPEQLHAVVAKIGELLESKLSALDDQYKEGMGTIAQGRQMLTPKSRQTLDKLEQKTGTGTPVPRINTKEEWDKLPSGAQYIDAQDGKPYTKR